MTFLCFIFNNLMIKKLGAVQNPETQNPDRPKSRYSKSRNPKSRQVQNPDRVKIPTGQNPEIQNPDRSKSRKIGPIKFSLMLPGIKFRDFFLVLSFGQVDFFRIYSLTLFIILIMYYIIYL